MTFLPLYNLLKSLAKHEPFFNDILPITEISAHNKRTGFLERTMLFCCYIIVLLL